MQLEAIPVGVSFTITPVGRQMLHFPINPLLAKVLIASFELGCTSEVVDIIALREAGNPILESYSTREQADKTRRAFVHRDGDHMTGMNVLRAFLEVLDQARKENPQAAAGDKSVRKAVTDWCNEHSLSFRVLNEARLLRTQLQQLVKSTGQDPEVSAGEDSSRVMQCLSKGLYMNAARLQPDGLSYQPVLNRISDKVSRGECTNAVDVLGRLNTARLL
jgi:HrpA-like RNA helicase